MKARVSVLASLALMALGGLAGCGDPTVIRIIDGKPVEGRFIPYEAYAYYARGADFEAHGDSRAAVESYRAAVELDPKSAEIWTRLGATLCANDASPGSVDEAFEHAEDLDPSYERLYRERALCASSKGRVKEALTFATRSLELDPNRDEVVLLYASLLERTGDVKGAERALDELVITRPTSIKGWLARYELALRRGDRFTAERTGRTLGQRAPSFAPRVQAEVPALSPLAEVDAAIGREDLEAARKAASHARLPAPELAVRAAALGRAKLARDQAELVLGADPSSTSARIALAVAADLMNDTNTLASALGPPAGIAEVPPSALARLLFTELVARRAGREAAKAFYGTDLTPNAEPRPADPLLESVRSRVNARLAS